MKNHTHWLLALGGAFALSACTTNNQYSYLEITQLEPPTGAANPDGGTPTGCSYVAGTQTYSQQAFFVDADFAPGIEVQNNLLSNANLALGRLNTNDFVVKRVVTSYESTDGTAINEPEQTTPAEGLIPASSTGVIQGTIIPTAIAGDLESVSAVRLHIRVEGYLLDGSTVRTNEFIAVGVPIGPTSPSGGDSATCVAQ